MEEREEKKIWKVGCETLKIFVGVKRLSFMKHMCECNNINGNTMEA